MAWELLPVDYTDAVWSGLKRYNEISNDDGTVSFQDVTQYSGKEKSFFGARDANRMNEALNTLMSMVENGDDLYTAFQNYFAQQKTQFEDASGQTLSEFESHVDAKTAECDTRAEEATTELETRMGVLERMGDQIVSDLQTKYRDEMDTYEAEQKQLFDEWFAYVQSQLSGDVAGNLQNQINELDDKVDGCVAKKTVFSPNGRFITETSGQDKIETEFVSDKQIVQKFYANNVLSKTKTITFSDDGLDITEEVS